MNLENQQTLLEKS